MLERENKLYGFRADIIPIIGQIGVKLNLVGEIQSDFRIYLAKLIELNLFMIVGDEKAIVNGLDGDDQRVPFLEEKSEYLQLIFTKTSPFDCDKAPEQMKNRM